MLLALAIGIACGVAGYALGMPLPWMLGPMLGVTVAAIAGVPLRGPARLRPIVIPVIGVMLGSAITADLFRQGESWLLTLALLPPFLLLAAGVSFVIYRRIGRYDAVTAFYAAMPGGLNEMLILGAAAGGDDKRIALAHAARVLFVILFVVLFFGLILGVQRGPSDSSWTTLSALTALDYAILTFCAVAGHFLGRALRLPAAPVFGPMILSGIAHVTGWVVLPPPDVIVIVAQVVIGTVIGSRFVGAALSEIGRDLLLAITSSLAMIAVATGFAALIAWGAAMPLTQVFLAFSPGGLTEMSLLTLALGQDAAYVSVIHIIRITLVIGVAPYIFSALRGRLGR